MAPKQTDETKKVCLTELRDKISDATEDTYMRSDAYLLNWLAEKKYKVEKAEKALRLSLQWRKDNKIDAIMDETFDESWIPTQLDFIGHDKGGRPVMLISSKFSEITEEMMSAAMERALKDKETSIRYSHYLAEKTERAIKDAAKATTLSVSSVTVVLDMKGIKLTDYTKYVKKVLPLALDTLKTLEENYPGILNELIIVNSPKKAIRLVLTMLRPVMRSDHLDKVHVYGRKSHKWIPILLAKIDANVLPVSLGGTKDDIPQSANL